MKKLTVNQSVKNHFIDSGTEKISLKEEAISHDPYEEVWVM